MLYSRSLLVIYFVYSNVYMITKTSYITPLLIPPSLFGKLVNLLSVSVSL